MSTLGLKFSAETRAKMSAAHKGRKMSPEARARMSAAQKNRTVSDETKRKLSEAAKGRTHSAETRAKMSKAHKGKIKTPEHLANISKAKKGVPQKIPQTPEQREKNRQAQIGNQRAKGYRFSSEQRARLSEGVRRRWEDGVYDHKHPCWGKAGIHAGVKMRCLNSEGVFAQDCDGAGIKWQYEPRRFRLSWCSYRPDFYLPEFDIWVEIKGYPEMPGQWKRKVTTFRQETGKTLVVVFQHELSSLRYEVGD